MSFLLILCNSFNGLLLKVNVSFIFSYKGQGGLFPAHGLDLPTLSRSGNCHLTKFSFRFLLILKPIIGTSRNTFLSPSSDARITCNSSKIFLTTRNTGWYWFYRLLTFSKSVSLGITLARRIFFHCSLFLIDISLSRCIFYKTTHYLNKFC